ncbi:epoxide hydrolase 1 [Streptomyces mirabilis]|nr:epoxide hydrolase 1 [Streptomyces mirabilis]
MTIPHAFPLEPTPIHVSDEVLDDLRARLTLTRPPLDEGNGDWSYGVPDSYLRELVAYWRDGYDWRKAEAAINIYEHYQVSVAGVPVHFMGKPGRGPRPIPLILTHGWPWTFWHWSKVIDPLADPAAFGGDPADAFDVIVPSLPGFGFPGPLTGFSDVNFWKVSDLWHTLMTETLGYEKYAAGGCDIGGILSSQLGHKYADELYGIHIGSGLPLDFFTGHRAWDFARNRPLTDDQPADVRARIIELDHRSASHLAVHMLEGATLAHGLSDSPAGLLAWLLERLERQRRQRGVRLHQGRPAHPRHDLLGEQLHRHVDALLRQRQPLPQLITSRGWPAHRPAVSPRFTERPTDGSGRWLRSGRAGGVPD